MESTSARSDLLLLGGTPDISEILDLLEQRFLQGSIYTGLGNVLISLNPFERLDSLRAKAEVSDYYNKVCNLLTLKPHVFRTAELTLREIRNNNCKDVSVVITGESGAGKTVAARMMTDYYSAASSKIGRGRLIEQQLPESSVIMEYFGNAQTKRSANSSRFAKLTRIYFDSTYKVVGTVQQSYMLEKSRVTSRDPAERNYHCFYAMLRGMSEVDKKKYHLKSIDFYDILRVDEKCHLHDLIDDSARYRAFNLAISVFDHKASFMDDCTRVLSALLWIGNVKFESVSESSVLIKNPDTIKIAAEMLNIKFPALEDVLINKTLYVGSRSEMTKSPYNIAQAVNFRDTLIRTIYDELFNLVIEKLNENLSPKSPHCHSITIVDAFGFESFDINSIEQLCINHANERLYNSFINVAVKSELETYEEEGLGKIDLHVPESKEYMSLMQDKLNGIFTVVDEQCKFPKATDMTLAEGIRRFHSGNALFKSIIDKPDCFTIGHYAGDVVYCSIGFLEKSKLTISEGIINIAKSSTLPFFKGFFSKYSEGIGVQKANSTGYRFCKRLDDLVLELERSAVFFIKCLRSNYSFSEYSWDREAVRAQLLASGIPQALKVAKSVLPAKLRYEDVYNKYYILLGYEKRARVTGDPPSIAKMILSVAGITKGFATGRTLMLLDAEASSKLEELRIEKISRTVVILQKNFRAFLARKYYIKQKKAAITLQSAAIGLLARRYVAKLHACATKIQAVWRGIRARRSYKKLVADRDERERVRLRALAKAERALKEKAAKDAAEAAAKASKRKVSVASPAIGVGPCSREIKTTAISYPEYSSLPSPPKTLDGASDMTGSLKKASESLISTISSAISVSSSGSRAPSYDSSYKYQSYRYRSLSSGSNTLKLMLGDTVFLDVSSIDADSPDNQLVRYAEEHVYCGKKSTSGSVMESLFKPRNALSDVEYRLAPKNAPNSVPILISVFDEGTLSKTAVNIFKNLLKFTSSRPMKYAVLVDIINTGITVPEIRDEIYMQIMRQTNISKPPKSSERNEISTLYSYWFACNAVCNAFPPSRDLFLYAISYFTRSAKLFKGVCESIYRCISMCILVVRKLYAVGPRVTSLSYNEVSLMDGDKKYAELCVDISHGASVKCKIYSHTLIGEVLAYVFGKLGLRNTPRWGLFLKANLTVDIPLDTKGYVYDEIRRVLQFVRPNSKSSIDFSFSDVFATTKRIVFGGKDIPELLNVMLSTSLMSQVAQGLWYSSLFLDTKLSLELASLYLAYEASDTNIRLSNSDQFLQKVKSCLPSQVVSKLPKDLIDSCFELYQSNARMQKEIIMRTYLNTALSRNDVHAMLHYGMLVNDNQSCILALSLGGVSITRILDMTLVVSIPINLLIYCEETEGIVNLYSITDGVQKGVLNCCPLIVHSIRTASSLTILDYLDKLVSPREETINVLRRIINIADSGAECSIIKARSALIDNDIVRPLTLDEETQYNTFIESQANIEKLRSGTQSGLRNVFAFSLRSKRTLDTLKSSVDSIPREKSDLLTSILTPLSYMWINYPLELKRPLSTGRVPATWSVEAWNSLVSLKKVQLEWLGVLKEFFLKMCFGAPQPYVDELYLILAKLTNGAYVNSNITTNVYIYRLWTAFALIIHYFGPSPLVYDYVHAHVRSALKLYLSKKEPRLSRLILAVNHCRKNLLSTPVIPRKRVPSSVELDYCITLFHVAIGLRLFNPNEVMVVEIKPLTTLNKLSQIVMNRIGMREAPSASYAIYKKSDQGLFMPDKNSYVFDVLDIKDRTPDDTSSDTEVFVIRRVLELRNISSIVSMDEKYNYVRQIISDINCDYLPIPATLNFAKIAAYLLQYEYGDYNINTTISIYEKICESYIPLSLRDKREVTPHNIREWHMALTRVSKGAAVVELATMLSRWKLHNAVIFDVEQEHDISANKKCKLALIPGEILIDPSPDGQRYASRIPLSAVTGVFDHEDNTIIVYDSDTGVTRVIFSTRRHSELSYFVNVFCGST